MPGTLIFLCGLPFAGKSTLARVLVARTGATYIALDAVNSERGVGLNGSAITPAQWDASYAEVYRRLEEALLAGERVVYDETCFLRAQRDAIRAIAGRAEASAQLIWVTVPEAIARARWLANRQSGERYDVRDEDFAQVVTRFAAPTPDEKPLRYDGSIPAEEWLAMVDLWA